MKYKQLGYGLAGALVLTGLMATIAFIQIGDSNLLFQLFNSIHLNTIVKAMESLGKGAFATTATIGIVAGGALAFWNSSRTSTPLTEATTTNNALTA